MTPDGADGAGLAVDERGFAAMGRTRLGQHRAATRDPRLAHACDGPRRLDVLQATQRLLMLWPVDLDHRENRDAGRHP